MQPFMDALIDERFANGYRESSADLAAAIRKCSVTGPSVGAPRTQVTDRPVTIVTRSLISQPKHAPVVETLSPVLASPGLPAAMPPFVLSAHATAEELGSVHGCHTASVHTLPVRTIPRWTFGVLGVATLLGVIAAVAIQSSPAGDDATTPVTVRVEEIKPLDEKSNDLSAAVVAPTIAVVLPPSPIEEAKPAVVEPKPVAVEPKPKTHTQRVAAVAHPAVAPAAPSGRKQFVRVSLGAEMWGYLIIDGGAKNEALTNQPITPGKHRFRVIPGTTDDGLEPMTCTFTINPDKVVTTISVNLATRVAIGADSCGR